MKIITYNEILWFLFNTIYILYQVNTDIMIYILKQGQGISFRSAGEILYVASNSIYTATLLPCHPVCPLKTATFY